MSYSNRHIFFDLDRTLWDFETNSRKALLILFDQIGLLKGKCSFEQFHKIYLRNNHLLWHLYSVGQLDKEVLRYERFRATLKHFSVMDEAITRQLGDGYVDLSPKQTALLPHAQSVLEDLSEMGFNLHIITNGFLEVQHIKLEYAKLHHHFQVILCSEEVGVNKPQPKIFIQAMAQANALAKQSLMVGDDYRADVLGAMRVGMQAVWFQRDRKHRSKFENRIDCLSHLPQLAAKLLA
ncbi:MAG: YjjG family noncanonical pyrimidine nucleotidase [Bacteroidetes bacterium]|nr:YjjG family noncanonical pyrimidine nucleotidase [Bacteroidota bacterium]MBM3424693.1 noncanonical pyrimidine nucleotidase, YjjG family [Bacteroidota bacterium]